MATQFKDSDLQIATRSEDSLSARILVIGNLGRWTSEGRITSALRDFDFLELDAVSTERLAEFAPDIILSPLVADDFDVIDVVDKLTACGFQGRYRVIAEDLPDQDLIRREVRGHAPTLDFDLLLMPGEPSEKALRDVSDRPQTVLHFSDTPKQKAQGG